MACMKGPLASENRAGMVKLASTEEAVNGNVTTKAVTPAGVAAAIEASTDMESRLLGVTFDGINAAGTRTYGAANKQWSKSTDTSAGVDTFAETSIFRGYYALVKYNAETQKAEIIAKEGTAEYAAIKAAGTEDYDEVRMFHVFYYKKTVNADGSQSIVLSPIQLEGFKPSPMHLRNGVLHEWVGITRYAWGRTGSTTIAARAGLYPLTDTNENTFETRARARGMRVFGMNEVAALQMLGSVKYAHQNWQTAIGSGFSGAPTSDRTVAVAQTNANSVILDATYAADFPVGASIYLGSNNFRTITANEEYSEDNTKIVVSFDGDPFTSTTSTKVHGGLAKNGSADVVQGLDGENVGMHTTAARRSIVTLGIENLFGNCWKLLSGVMRMGGFSYHNPDPDGQYAWPTLEDNKGWKKGPAIMTTEGYIKRFVPSSDLGDMQHLSIPVELGGNATNPVGDYQYTNNSTDPRMCIFGGNLDRGAYDGPFFFFWSNPVSNSWWSHGALGVFVPSAEV